MEASPSLSMRKFGGDGEVKAQQIAAERV